MTRRLTGAFLLLAMTGCSSLQPVVQPASFVTERSPKYVLITTAEAEDGEDPILLTQPRIQSENLVGYDLYGEATQVPVSRIRVMKASQFSAPRTTFLIVGGSAAAGIIGYMLAHRGKQIDPTHCPPPRCENFPH